MVWNSDSLETEEGQQERVKRIVVPEYKHNESGLPLSFREMSLYLLNEEDFDIDARDFDPSRHEHAIPKFEMARIYLTVCALMGDRLGFTDADRDDPVYRIYALAYQRCLAFEKNPEIIYHIKKLGLASGFEDLPH